MTRIAGKSILFSLLLALCAVAPAWAQPYFERSQVIQNPRPNPESGFGEDVDVDGEWMVVAADESAAYVYRKSGTTWTQFTRLVCPVASCSRQNPDRGFGGTVTVDGTTIVVAIQRNLRVVGVRAGDLVAAQLHHRRLDRSGRRRAADHGR